MSQGGLLDIEAANPQIPTTFTTDSGSAVPLGNIIEIAGGTSVSTTASGNTVTINFAGSSTYLQIANNLSDVADASTSRENLGLGSGAPANGALLIGNGVDFTTASLTSSDGTISFVAGAGTLDLSATVSGALMFAADSGAPATPAADTITLAGGTNIATVATSNTVTFNFDGTLPVSSGGTGATNLTDGGILLGSGSGAITATSQPTDGQLLIGSTGVDPVLATLTEGTGIDITNGAGSITVAVDTTEIGNIPTSFPTDSGTATPSGNALTVTGSGGISTSGSGATITIDGSGIAGGITTLAGDTGTATGTTVTIAGGTGITTSATSSTVTVNLDTPVTVPDGGTGQTSFTDGSVLLGNGTNAIDEVTLTNGRILIGSTGANPVAAYLTEGNGLDITNGAGSIILTVDPNEFADEMPYKEVNYGWVYNLSWSYSSGVLTVAGNNGSALSAGNPGYALIKSNVNVGRYAVVSFTSNQTLTVSDMTGNTFGTTASVAWSTSGLPLFIGIMADASDTNPVFVVTRLPHLRVSPASSGDIGDPSSATADTEQSVFAFDDITEADYTSKNLIILGAIAVTKDSSDVYTLTTAASSYSGVGDWGDGVTYGFPLGQNGANSSNYLLNNGGTAPVFSTSGYSYWISREGKVRIETRLSGDGGTDGSGAVSTTMALPLEVSNFSVSDTKPIGTFFVSSVSGGSRPCMSYALDTTNRNFMQFSEMETGNNVQNGDFTNGGRNIWGYCEYYAYNGSS